MGGIDHQRRGQGNLMRFLISNHVLQVLIDAPYTIADFRSSDEHDDLKEMLKLSVCVYRSHHNRTTRFLGGRRELKDFYLHEIRRRLGSFRFQFD